MFTIAPGLKENTAALKKLVSVASSLPPVLFPAPFPLPKPQNAWSHSEEFSDCSDCGMLHTTYKQQLLMNFLNFMHLGGASGSKGATSDISPLQQSSATPGSPVDETKLFSEFR